MVISNDLRPMSTIFLVEPKRVEPKFFSRGGGGRECSRWIAADSSFCDWGLVLKMWVCKDGGFGLGGGWAWGCGIGGGGAGIGSGGDGVGGSGIGLCGKDGRFCLDDGIGGGIVVCCVDGYCGWVVGWVLI